VDEIKYTIDDLIHLREVLKGNSPSYADLSSLFLDMVLNKAKKKILDQELTSNDIEELLRVWIMGDSHTRSICGELYHFIFNTELDKVPLYINSEKFKPFVQWRFKIAK
jgi:hypothetical protein